MEEKFSSNPKRTIGLLGNELLFEMPVVIYNTIKALTEEHQYQFIYLVGHPYKDPYNFGSQANILYHLAAPANIDGLILMSNLLASFVSVRDFQQRCLEFAPLPMVSIGLPLEGIPSVVLDNETGMYNAVCHLIEVHGYTRIGFLLGPTEHPEVISRFRAYRRAMEKHNLPLDESPGNDQQSDGKKRYAQDE